MPSLKINAIINSFTTEKFFFVVLCYYEINKPKKSFLIHNQILKCFIEGWNKKFKKSKKVKFKFYFFLILAIQKCTID